MARPHATTPVLALALAALLAACNMGLREVGKAPEGELREYPGAVIRRPGAGRTPATQPGQAGDSDRAPADTSCVGDSGTRYFHRPDCAALADVPADRRIAFASYYVALNTTFAPCRRCTPGPR